MENVGGMILLVTIGTIICALIVYQVIKFMKGHIKISLPKTAYTSGEKITGSFNMLTKKEIDGNRVFIALFSQEVTTTRHQGKTRTSTREIFRNEVTLESERTYSAGENKNYEFSLDTPSSQSPETINSPLGDILKTGLNVLTGRRTYLRWWLEARLDAKGVDLSNRKKLSIDIK